MGGNPPRQDVKRVVQRPDPNALETRRKHELVLVDRSSPARCRPSHCIRASPRPERRLPSHVQVYRSPYNRSEGRFAIETEPNVGGKAGA